jgi:hypothetical protein
VCQQLWEECLPLFRASIHHVIDLADLPRFLDDLVFTDGFTDTTATGDLDIEIADSIAALDSKGIDILPLIKLRAGTHSIDHPFRVKFIDDEDYGLNRLLACCNGIKAKSFVERYVSSFTIAKQHGKVVPVIIFRGAYFEGPGADFKKILNRGPVMPWNHQQMAARVAWEKSLGIKVPALRQCVCIKVGGIKVPVDKVQG